MRIFFSVVAAMVFCCGCRSVDDNKAPEVVMQDFTVEAERAGKQLAADFASAFFSAVQKKDFALWQRVLSGSAAQKMSPELFGKMVQELELTLGTLDTTDYLGVLHKDSLRDHLWKMRFVKNGKTRDVIYLVRVWSPETNTPEISGFGIRRF